MNSLNHCRLPILVAEVPDRAPRARLRTRYGWRRTKLQLRTRRLGPRDECLLEHVEFGFGGRWDVDVGVRIRDDEPMGEGGVGVQLGVEAPKQGVDLKLKSVGVRSVAGLEVGDLTTCFVDGDEVGGAAPSELLGAEANLRVRAWTEGPTHRWTRVARQRGRRRCEAKA
jgi:hypothetical protein